MPVAAAIPIAAGIIGAGASAGASAAGVGRNTAVSKDFSGSPAYDANKFNYGGTANGAENTANRYASAAQAAQGRTGPQADYTQANNWQLESQASRNNMGQVANAMQARALGQVPSIADQQASIDSQRAMAQQASLASSARGAAGLALAGQQAANNTANAQSAISQQAQVNAANERMQAEQAAAGAWANMRGQDQQAWNQAAGQSQFNTQMDMQQRGLNDQYALGMTQNEMAVRQQQLQANAQQQGMLAGSWNQAMGWNAQRNQQNADAGMKHFQGGLGALLGGFQGGGAQMMGGAGGAAGGGGK